MKEGGGGERDNGNPRAPIGTVDHEDDRGTKHKSTCMSSVVTIARLALNS